MKETEATLISWDEVPLEQLNPLLQRQMISGERVMLTQIYLKKGCVVPLHQHENEQFSYVVTGCMKFWLGADKGKEIVVKTGEVLHLPSNLPHSAVAMEDTVDFDIFSPPRQDWLNKEDDYLREK